MIETDKQVEDIAENLQVNEIAKIADVDDRVAILVYSQDHEPPHFHVGKINTSGIRVKIPNRTFVNATEMENCVLEEDRHLIKACELPCPEGRGLPLNSSPD